MNIRQDFKMVKQVLIEQRWIFDKIQKQKGDFVDKERSYNRSIIQSAFFFTNLSNDWHRQLCKQMELSFFCCIS